MHAPNQQARCGHPRPVQFTLTELLVLLIVLALIAFLILPGFGGSAREKANRVRCAGNLKRIGSAMLLYSGDYGGAFPIDGAPGTTEFSPLNRLHPLHRTDPLLTVYLADGAVYACHSRLRRTWFDKRPISTQTAANADYIYVGSGLKDDNTLATQIRVAFDASGNHPENQWMNALFIDGHAEGRRPDGTRGWNTYTNPTSPDPAGIVPPAPSAITTSPIASPDAAVTFPATP